MFVSVSVSFLALVVVAILKYGVVVCVDVDEESKLIFKVGENDGAREEVGEEQHDSKQLLESIQMFSFGQNRYLLSKVAVVVTGLGVEILEDIM